MPQIFEGVMLVCFGSAWPFSIWKSFSSKNNEGKSLPFLWIIFIGYLCGITHKILAVPDKITFLYALNALMVLTDITLFYRNRTFANKSAA
ncbi:hypothetical protein JXL83_09115 [candidate division WOR-3 bacterium]|nr:hypothetical protein [candidate division WOR-3 bacterium]